jgi:hypothetical protein
MPDAGVMDPSVLFLVRVAAEAFIRESVVDINSIPPSVYGLAIHAALHNA